MKSICCDLKFYAQRNHQAAIDGNSIQAKVNAGVVVVKNSSTSTLVVKPTVTTKFVSVSILPCA